jgi:hypothetical protein
MYEIWRVKGGVTCGTMEQKSCFYIKLQTCSVYFAETNMKYNVLSIFWESDVLISSL